MSTRRVGTRPSARQQASSFDRQKKGVGRALALMKFLFTDSKSAKTYFYLFLVASSLEDSYEMLLSYATLVVESSHMGFPRSLFDLAMARCCAQSLSRPGRPGSTGVDEGATHGFHLLSYPDWDRCSSASRPLSKGCCLRGSVAYLHLHHLLLLPYPQQTSTETYSMQNSLSSPFAVCGGVPIQPFRSLSF